MLDKTQAVSLVMLPARPTHRRTAVVVSFVIVAIALLSEPIARQQWAVIDPFLPIYITAIFFAELITGCLFLGQFLVERRASVMILVATYFSSSFTSIFYLLSFPGVFATQNFLGSDAQTTSWMWIFWHLLFPGGMLAYVLVEKFHTGQPLSPRQTRHWVFLVSTIALVLVAAIVITAYYNNDWLPTMNQQNSYSVLFSSGVGPFIWVVTFLALGGLVYLTGGQNVAQLWLTVAVLAWLLDTVISVLGGVRFSGGWYMSRINSLFTSLVVLGGLVYEVGNLYSRLLQQDKDLHEALKAREEFISLAAHELKTPVTSLRGFAQMLVRQLNKPDLDRPRLIQGLTTIDEQSTRLGRLVNRLLDLSHLEDGGQLSIQKELTDVSRSVEQLVRQTQVLTDRHTFTTRLSPDLRACLDPLRFEQVVANLLDNAVKYSPKGGNIEVTLKLVPATSMLHLTVQDQGIGIPAEYISRIFEPFYQIENRAVSGLGLGLYVAYQIVQLHGGTIVVEIPPEGGTCFVVDWPQNMKEALPATTNNSTLAPPA